MTCPKDTIRILSLDGGGIRGVFSATWLDLFCKRAGIDESKLFEFFDVIAGTSIGGIQAIAYADGKSPEFMKNLFLSKGKDIFSLYNHPSHHTSDSALGKTFDAVSAAADIILHAGELEAKLTPLGALASFITGAEALSIEGSIKDLLHDLYTLLAGLLVSDEKQGHELSIIMGTELSNNSDYVNSKSFYLNQELENTINSVVGNKRVNEILGKFVVTGWNVSRHKPALISNVTGLGGYLTGDSFFAKEAALITSAAPLYLPEVTVNGGRYIDGGVIQNNPAEVAFHTARRMFPAAPKVCLLSVGTTSPYPNENMTGNMGKYIPHNVQRIAYLISNVFMGGVQKLVDETMAFNAQSLYHNYHYYRCDYTFGENDPYKDAPMDNTTPAYLQKLQDVATERFNNDLPAIDNFIEHLKVV